MARNAGPEWRYSALLNAFGYDRDVADAIKAAGFEPPPIRTISGWRARNSVPSQWAPLMILLGIERGYVTHIRRLLKKAEASR
jgi:hypothetical protein